MCREAGNSEDELWKVLAQLRGHEIDCRNMYLANPEGYDRPVHGWNEFVRYYRSTDRSGYELGDKPPVFMGNLLTEQDCFGDDRQEVSVILHDRYAPPSYHNLRFIKIVYALKGSCRIFAKDKGTDRETLLLEGDFVIIPPEMDQAVFTCEEDAVTVNIVIKRSTFGDAFYSLLLENDSISDFFWQMLYSKGNTRGLVVRCGNDRQLTDIILEMCRESLLEERCSNIVMKGYVILFFGRVLKNHQQDMSSVGSTSAGAAALPVMMRYMRENFSTVTLSAMAGHFGRSEGYMSRYIRRETGKTFRFLLRECRTRQAAEIIENSSCSIEEAAAAVGYSDISCFYRNFKETYGMTPMQFRNKKNRVIL